MTSSTVSRNLCHEWRSGRAAQQEVVQLLTLDLEGGILPPSLLLPPLLLRIPGHPTSFPAHGRLTMGIQIVGLAGYCVTSRPNGTASVAEGSCMHRTDNGGYGPRAP